MIKIYGVKLKNIMKSEPSCEKIEVLLDEKNLYDYELESRVKELIEHRKMLDNMIETSKRDKMMMVIPHIVSMKKNIEEQIVECINNIKNL